MADYSDYIIYVDESGDHSLTSIDPSYPVFVLTFCIVHKQEYADKIVPAVKKMKFDIFGHDDIILHEHEIRKSKNDFTLLMNPEKREIFHSRLHEIMTEAPISIIATVINKKALLGKYASPYNPYHIALGLCLERASQFLAAKGQESRLNHIIVESRGKNEDQDLELQFRRIIQPSLLNMGANSLRYQLAGVPYELRFTKKTANMAGLQLADMTARPIGRYVMDPSQPNRAMDTIKDKLLKTGGQGSESFIDFGLKVFPSYP